MSLLDRMKNLKALEICNIKLKVFSARHKDGEYDGGFAYII